MTTTTCGYRGCTEPHDWANGYHCERHAEILRRQRVAAGERNRENARIRHLPEAEQRAFYEAQIRDRRSGGV